MSRARGVHDRAAALIRSTAAAAHYQDSTSAPPLEAAGEAARPGAQEDRAGANGGAPTFEVRHVNVRYSTDPAPDTANSTGSTLVVNPAELLECLVNGASSSTSYWED